MEMLYVWSPRVATSSHYQLIIFSTLTTGRRDAFFKSYQGTSAYTCDNRSSTQLSKCYCFIFNVNTAGKLK